MKTKIKWSFFKDKFGWRIMDSYILLKFLGTVFYSIALLMTIIVVFDISENINRFLDNNIPVGAIVTEYYFNFVPYFINLFFPLFTFISVIWFTSKLSGNNEIISFFNGGVSFYRFMIPYIAGAIILSIISLAMSNFLIPHTNAEMYKFKEQRLQKRKIISSSNIHFKNGTDTYVYAERWKKKTMNGEKFTYETLGKELISQKISAAEITYNPDNKHWILSDYMIRSFDTNKRENIRTGDRLDTTFSFTPDDFNNDATVSETMSYGELKEAIQKAEEKGSNLVKFYSIERHKRLANPLSILIMTFLGLSVAARKTRRGVGVHIFIGLFFVFTFIFFQQVSNVFAISGQLSPVLATWLPNLTYLFICIILLRFTPK